MELESSSSFAYLSDHKTKLFGLAYYIDTTSIYIYTYIHTYMINEHMHLSYLTHEKNISCLSVAT